MQIIPELKDPELKEHSPYTIHIVLSVSYSQNKPISCFNFISNS